MSAIRLSIRRLDETPAESVGESKPSRQQFRSGARRHGFVRPGDDSLDD
jgi:hypothetical protein